MAGRERLSAIARDGDRLSAKGLADQWSTSPFSVS